MRRHIRSYQRLSLAQSLPPTFLLEEREDFPKEWFQQVLVRLKTILHTNPLQRMHLCRLQFLR